MLIPIVELITESDVEQKLIWPLLTAMFPDGFGLFAPDIVTKLSIRRLTIGKGSSRKLYFPDYMIVLAGLPVLVIEAKAPGESVEQGLDEARLYGNELNCIFPSSINPCVRVLSCNGDTIMSCPIDTAEPDIILAHSDLTSTHSGFAKLVDFCCRTSLQRHADDIRRKLRKDT